MKKINLIFAFLLMLGSAGAASAATLSWVSTQAESHITSDNGDHIAVQYGFEDDETGSFSHSYSFQGGPATVFYTELRNRWINATITLDGVAMVFNPAEGEWSGNVIANSLHNIVISGNLIRPNQQYDILINSAVPVPAAVWLFGSGALGLLGLSRRKSRPSA